MEIKLTLALPRDALSVPVARGVLKQSMEVLGVDHGVRADIELALTEACTNVLDHAGEADEYEVSAGIDGERCIIEVVDRGAGFDSTDVGLRNADHRAEEGRGIQLMRALVDTVSFENQPQDGAVVHLEKALELKDASPMKRLNDRRSP